MILRAAVLSAQQQDEFTRLGFVRVRGVFSDAAAARMCERIWGELERRHGVRRDAPDTWRVQQPRHLQALRRDGAFDALGSPVLLETLDELLGPGTWRPPPHWGEALPAFPCGVADWTLPFDQWHIDWPARGEPEPLFGLKLLAFVAPVVAQGGGTVVLAGSHRLVARVVAAAGPRDRGHSSAARAQLARTSPWLCDLWSHAVHDDRVRRFMREGGVVDGIPVRVVELTGTPGEVIVFHPWLFHAPAPNCTRAPRIVVGHNQHTVHGLARFAAVGG